MNVLPTKKEETNKKECTGKCDKCKAKIARQREQEAAEKKRLAGN